MILENLQKAYYSAIVTAQLVKRGIHPTLSAIQQGLSKLLPRGVNRTSTQVPRVTAGAKVKFKTIHECYDRLYRDTEILYGTIDKLSDTLTKSQQNYEQKKAELTRRLSLPAVITVSGAILAKEDDLKNASTIDLSETTASVDFSNGIALPKTSRNIAWYSPSEFTVITSGNEITGEIDSCFNDYSNQYWKSNGNSEIIITFPNLVEVSALQINPVGILDVEVATSTDGVGFNTCVSTKLIISKRLEFNSIQCKAIRVRMIGEMTGLRTLKIGQYAKESGDYLTTNYFSIPSGQFGIPAINSIQLEPQGYIQFSGSTNWFPSDWVAQEEIKYFEAITQSSTSVVTGGYCQLSGFSGVTFGPYTSVKGGYDSIEVTTGSLLGGSSTYTQLPAYPNFVSTARFATDTFCGVVTANSVDALKIIPSKMAAGTYAYFEFDLEDCSALTLKVPSGIVGSVKLYIDNNLACTLTSTTTAEASTFCSSSVRVRLEVINQGCNIYQHILLTGIDNATIHSTLQEYSPSNYYNLIALNVPDFSYSFKDDNIYVPLIPYAQKIRVYYREHPQDSVITAFRLRFNVEGSLDKYKVVVK